MMSNLKLREATERDTAQLLAVIQGAFDQYHGQLDPPSGAHKETVESVKDKLKTAHAVLAEVDGEIVGCVFYEARDGFVDLHRLGVLPGYRRRGIAAALIEYVEQQAVRSQAPRVRLGVRVQQRDNRAYYERLGYRFLRNGYHPGYSQPTYLLMEKDLNQNPKGL
jgi:ribosomal protein S18 acetylase RimI-like enzyme